MSKFDLGDSGGGGGFSDEKNDNQDTKIDDTMQSTQKSKNDWKMTLIDKLCNNRKECE